MILIITHKEDYTADFVINRLNKAHIPYLRFNCEDIHEYYINVKNNDNFITTIQDSTKFESIWFRRTKNANITHPDLGTQLHLINEYNVLFNNLLEIIDGNWISKPNNIYRAESKLLQLKTASNTGFTVPNTLISNSINDITDFFNSNNKTIIKPLSHGRININNEIKLIFTNILTQEHINRLHEYNLTPCIFQEYIEKDYEIRVTVLRSKVFPAKVESQSDAQTLVDWRKKRLKFTAYKLPTNIEDLCIQIVKDLGLEFGAIDLIKTKTGSYVFLEINPNGQWAWIENDTGLPIANELVTCLTS